MALSLSPQVVCGHFAPSLGNCRESRVESNMSRVETEKSRVESNMSRVETDMSRVIF